MMTAMEKAGKKLQSLLNSPSLITHPATTTPLPLITHSPTTSSPPLITHPPTTPPLPLITRPPTTTPFSYHSSIFNHSILLSLIHLQPIHQFFTLTFIHFNSFLHSFLSLPCVSHNGILDQSVLITMQNVNSRRLQIHTRHQLLSAPKTFYSINSYSY